jgi:hypothetical protein
VADQVEYLHQAINARWADPSIPYGVRLIPVTTYAGQSIATLPMAGEPHGQGLQKPFMARSRAFATGP